MKEKLEVDFIIKMCFMAGVPFPDTYKRLDKLSRYIWFGYVIFIHILIILMWLSITVELVLYGKDLEGSIMNVIFMAQVNFKIIYLFYKNQDFTKIFNRLVSLSAELHEKDDKYVAIHKKYLSRLRKYGRVKTGFEIGTLCGYVAGAILISFFVNPETLVMPIRMWIPYEPRGNPHFSLLCIFQGGTILSAVLKTSMTDLVFLTLLSLSSAILAYLKKAMNDMFDDEKRQEVDSGRARKDNVKFLWWVKKHQEITSVLVDAKPLFSAYLCASYGYIMIILFLGGVIFTSPDSEWDFAKKVLVMVNIVNNAFQLYLQCLATDILAKCGEEVADLTDSRLVNTSKELSRTYLFALSRAKKPITFTSAGINPLSSETFANMLKVTVTYFITVIQIRESKKRALTSIFTPDL